jgi:hypothetical protein
MHYYCSFLSPVVMQSFFFSPFFSYSLLYVYIFIYFVLYVSLMMLCHCIIILLKVLSFLFLWVLNEELFRMREQMKVLHIL